MTTEYGARWRSPRWIGLGVVIVAVALLGFTAPGRAATREFLASLRIERPKRVTAAYMAPAGSRYTRRMQDMVVRMISGALHDSLDEPEQEVGSVADAVALAGFTPLLAPAAHGAPRITVTGARDITVRVQRDQLTTILREAGAAADLPASLDGASVRVTTPRGIRIRYGDCPAPSDTTLQGQLQGPPPTTSANRDCIVLTERPGVSATLPSGLAVDRRLDIALEVSGASPDEARRMHDIFDWKTLLGLDLPRFVRSHDFVEVRGAKGVLMHQGWRRGPAYTLVWSASGTVYEMSGYGSPTEAVPLADSLSATPAS